MARISAPLLTYRLWMIPVAADDKQRIDAAEANRRGTASTAWRRPRRGAALRPGGWLSAAAPLPGSPTALPLRTPPRPPPPAVGAAIASAVRRLGIAIRPPGQSIELDGRPPVGAE